MSKYSFLSEATKSITKKQQKELIAEWKKLSAQLNVIGALSKKMSSRVSEIESALLPIAKEAEDKVFLVGTTLVKYQSSSRTSVSYSALFTEALTRVNEETKAALENYKLSITKTNVIESLEIVDPKVAVALKDINKNTTLEELQALAREILRLPDEQTAQDLTEGSIVTLVKSSINALKSAFKSVASSFKSLSVAVDNLVKVVDSEESAA